MFLRNNMKRLITFLATMTIFLTSFSQSSEVNKLTFDTGYYEGICQDSNSKNKYITYLYLQFLSNDDDTMLVVVPYKMRKSKDPSIYMKNIETMNTTIVKYLTELSEAIDDIENHEIINRPWSVSGFDNFTYFEVDSNRLSFSINIASIETNEIEVFYFDGTIDRHGYEINATIYSDGETFPKSDIKLELSSTIINQK